ncbi:MAG TPA: hypothetical protein VFB79_19690 [Candidatus Angelobacter sp.]|nr:hypothetical protein [Candidatus Angelobacter sp.]
MRIHEGTFAYDLEQLRDPRTQLLLKWRFRIFNLSPIEQVVYTGEADTREEAEKKARAQIVQLKAAKNESAA